MKENLAIAAVIFLFAFFIFSWGFIVGLEKATLDQHETAISAGVAKWTYDPESGRRKFEYPKPEEKKP